MGLSETSRRNFLKSGAVIAGSAVVLQVARAVPAARKQRPNLLFVMTDQQRADSIRALGNPQAVTPNLDRLVKRAVSFTNCYVTSPLCSPSRSAIQTGRYPHATGVLANDMALLPEQVTLAEILAPLGYSCAYVGKWHLGRGNQATQGYGAYVEPFTAKYRRWLRRQEPPVRWGRDIQWTGPHVGRSLLPQRLHRTTYLIDRAIEFLKSGPDQPFVLFCSIYPPHFPLCLPADWVRQFDATRVNLPPNHYDRLEHKPGVQRRYRYYLGNKPELALTPDQWREVIAHYYEMVRFADAQIGRLLDALDRQGLTHRTVTVFTSDHGDMTGAHQMLWKGPYMYEEVTRVPLILAGPPGMVGLKPGRRIERPVSHIDLLPTILEMLGATAPDSVQGRSLLPALVGDEAWGHELFCEYYDMDATDLPGDGSERSIVQARMPTLVKMIRSGNWKYSWRPFDTDELYDLASDPGELRNLAGDPSHLPTVTRLRERIRRWMRQTADPLADLL